jgi:hypothetical protein
LRHIHARRRSADASQIKQVIQRDKKIEIELVVEAHRYRFLPNVFMGSILRILTINFQEG